MEEKNQSTLKLLRKNASQYAHKQISKKKINDKKDKNFPHFYFFHRLKRLKI